MCTHKIINSVVHICIIYNMYILYYKVINEPFTQCIVKCNRTSPIEMDTLTFDHISKIMRGGVENIL